MCTSKIGKGPDPFIQKFETEGGSDGKEFAWYGRPGFDS